MGVHGTKPGVTTGEPSGGFSAKDPSTQTYAHRWTEAPGVCLRPGSFATHLAYRRRPKHIPAGSRRPCHLRFLRLLSDCTSSSVVLYRCVRACAKESIRSCSNFKVQHSYCPTTTANHEVPAGGAPSGLKFSKCTDAAAAPRLLPSDPQNQPRSTKAHMACPPRIPAPCIPEEGGGGGQVLHPRRCMCVCVCDCTINEGDPYVAVVQSAYLTRHVGRAVHVLVFEFIHGVRTSVVWRA